MVLKKKKKTWKLLQPGSMSTADSGQNGSIELTLAYCSAEIIQSIKN